MHIKVLVVRETVIGPVTAKRRWLRGGAAGVVLAGGLALTGGALAFASIPDANGAFHGCVRSSTGTLRLIDPGAGQTCKASETAVSWNKAGIEWQGAWMATRTYSRGDAVSYQGSSYLAVVTNTDVSPTSVGDWAVLSEAGAPGQNGTNGATILSGTGPPSDGIGASGDFYIAERGSLRYAIYGPAVRTCRRLPCTVSWGQGSSIVGSAGPAGATGPAGAVTADQTTSGRVDLENQTLWRLIKRLSARPKIRCRSYSTNGIETVAGAKVRASQTTCENWLRLPLQHRAATQANSISLLEK